jgi:predicted transcriptional regulator
MSTVTVEKTELKSNETPTSIATLITLEKPTKYSIQRLAASRHQTISYLVNVAIEEYLKKYAESQDMVMFQ